MSTQPELNSKIAPSRSARDQQDYIGAIGDKVANDQPLTDTERQFLADALRDVRRGEKADNAFGIRARRGERRCIDPGLTPSMQRRALAMGWIAVARLPDPEGFGYTLEKAFDEAAKYFDYSVDTLNSYWKADLKKLLVTREGPFFYPPPSRDRIPI